MKKKLLSILLTLSMVLTLLPVTAMAAGPDYTKNPSIAPPSAHLWGDDWTSPSVGDTSDSAFTEVGPWQKATISKASGSANISAWELSVNGLEAHTQWPTGGESVGNPGYYIGVSIPTAAGDKGPDTDGKAQTGSDVYYFSSYVDWMTYDYLTNPEVLETLRKETPDGYVEVGNEDYANFYLTIDPTNPGKDASAPNQPVTKYFILAKGEETDPRLYVFDISDVHVAYAASIASISETGVEKVTFTDGVKMAKLKDNGAAKNDGEDSNQNQVAIEGTDVVVTVELTNAETAQANTVLVTYQIGNDDDDEVTAPVTNVNGTNATLTIDGEDITGKLEVKGVTLEPKQSVPQVKIARPNFDLFPNFEKDGTGPWAKAEISTKATETENEYEVTIDVQGLESHGAKNDDAGAPTITSSDPAPMIGVAIPKAAGDDGKYGELYYTTWDTSENKPSGDFTANRKPDGYNIPGFDPTTGTPDYSSDDALACFYVSMNQTKLGQTYYIKAGAEGPLYIVTFTSDSSLSYYVTFTADAAKYLTNSLADAKDKSGNKVAPAGQEFTLAANTEALNTDNKQITSVTVTGTSPNTVLTAPYTFTMPYANVEVDVAIDDKADNTDLLVKKDGTTLAADTDATEQKKDYVLPLNSEASAELTAVIDGTNTEQLDAADTTWKITDGTAVTIDAVSGTSTKNEQGVVTGGAVKVTAQKTSANASAVITASLGTLTKTIKVNVAGDGSTNTGDPSLDITVVSASASEAIAKLGNMTLGDDSDETSIKIEGEANYVAWTDVTANAPDYLGDYTLGYFAILNFSKDGTPLANGEVTLTNPATGMTAGTTAALTADGNLVLYMNSSSNASKTATIVYGSGADAETYEVDYSAVKMKPVGLQVTSNNGTMNNGVLTIKTGEEATLTVTATGAKDKAAELKGILWQKISGNGETSVNPINANSTEASLVAGEAGESVQFTVEAKAGDGLHAKEVRLDFTVNVTETDPANLDLASITYVTGDGTQSVPGVSGDTLEYTVELEPNTIAENGTFYVLATAPDPNTDVTYAVDGISLEVKDSGAEATWVDGGVTVNITVTDTNNSSNTRTYHVTFTERDLRGDATLKSLTYKLGADADAETIAIVLTEEMEYTVKLAEPSDTTAVTVAATANDSNAKVACNIGTSPAGPGTAATASITQNLSDGLEIHVKVTAENGDDTEEYTVTFSYTTFTGSAEVEMGTAQEGSETLTGSAVDKAIQEAIENAVPKEGSSSTSGEAGKGNTEITLTISSTTGKVELNPDAAAKLAESVKSVEFTHTNEKGKKASVTLSDSALRVIAEAAVAAEENDATVSLEFEEKENTTTVDKPSGHTNDTVLGGLDVSVVKKKDGVETELPVQNLTTPMELSFTVDKDAVGENTVKVYYVDGSLWKPMDVQNQNEIRTSGLVRFLTNHLSEYVGVIEQNSGSEGGEEGEGTDDTKPGDTKPGDTAKPDDTTKPDDSTGTGTGTGSGSGSTGGSYSGGGSSGGYNGSTSSALGGGKKNSDGGVMGDGAVSTPTIIGGGSSGIFTDVPYGHTFATEIGWVQSNGIMSGYADGSFHPGANTTRQALWMALGRIAGAYPADMAAARTWAVNAGISDGSSATNNMSRQQMITMLYRFAQMQGMVVSGSNDLSGYPDYALVADYAKEALAWGVANGIINGTTDGKLNPEGTATRAHFAAFLYRFSNL